MHVYFLYTQQQTHNLQLLIQKIFRLLSVDGPCHIEHENPWMSSILAKLY